VTPTITRYISRDGVQHGARDHERYLQRQRGLPPAPHPDVSREQFAVSQYLPADTQQRINAWAQRTDFLARPYAVLSTNASPGTQYVAADPVAMSIGDRLAPAAAQLIGQPVWLSFAALNIFPRHTRLLRHRDVQPSDKWIIVWTLRQIEPASAWPIYIERPGAVDAYDTGDNTRALCFAGHDVYHWTDPYAGELGVKVYCNYHDDPAKLRVPPEEQQKLARRGEDELDGATPTWAGSAFVDDYWRKYKQTTDDPSVLTIQDFATPAECQALMELTGEKSTPRVYRGGTTAHRPDIWDSEIDYIDPSTGATTVHQRIAAACRAHADDLAPNESDRQRYVMPKRMLRTAYASGQKFDWHWDYRPNTNISNRRLTAILTLQAADAGGRLELALGSNATPPSPAGTLTVFSSRHFRHRITPIISGQRISAVAWLTAPDMTSD